MKRISAFFIVLALLITLLAGCSGSMRDRDSRGENARPAETAALEVEHYREARTYDEQGDWCGSATYDAKGHILSSYNASSLDEYRLTDRAKEMDTSEVAAMDGVVSVECRQNFYSDTGDPADLHEVECLIVIGYNSFGTAAVMRVYTFLEGWDKPVLRYQNLFEPDSNGNPIKMVRMAGNGEILLERTYENTYIGNKIISSTITDIKYGDLMQIDDHTERHPYDALRTTVQRCEYVYD